MEAFWNDMASQWPDTEGLLKVGFRLVLAAFVGALPGLQRERVHVAAGFGRICSFRWAAAIFMLAALD